MIQFFVSIFLLLFANAFCTEDNESVSEQDQVEEVTEESSVIDDIINTIAEAAISNPDYGKDIGDR